MSGGLLTWIAWGSLSLAALAGMFSAWASTRTTRKSSPRSSSADDAWRSEIDQEVADLKSAVRGLSSTLRRIDGRESARLRRSQSPSEDETGTPGDALKRRLRQKYGLAPVPKVNAPLSSTDNV